MQPTTFFKRSTLQRVGLLKTSLHYTMDWDLWARFAWAAAKVVYVPQILAANREYPHTKTNSGGIKRLHEILLTNMRNMTGFWPNAFFSFTAYELYQRCQKLDPFLRFYGILIAQFISMMSLNRLSCPKPRPLYGLFPHSSKCTEEPIFVIPKYEKRKPRSIQIEFSLPSGTETRAKVNVNGTILFDEILKPTTSIQLEVPINAELQNANCYYIAPRFFVDEQIVTSNIYSVKLI
jgi:hypothetical protein